LFSLAVDDDDMEPLDPGLRGAMMPPSGDQAAPAAPVTTRIPVTAAAPQPAAAPTWTATPPSPRPVVAEWGPTGSLRPMMPWRIAAAMALATMLAPIGWQVQRLTDDQPWSNALMWVSIVAGVAAVLSVIGWTWMTTDNARRLIGPAARANIPDPNVAVRTWIAPFFFVAIAMGVVAMAGRRVGSSGDQTVSAVPLAVALVALLLAIPLTYRPMNHLAGIVRQVGGSSVRVAQWMWVPVVMALVGVVSIVALRYAGIDGVSDTGDPLSTGANGAGVTDTAGWVPLWVVAVVAIGPCVVTVLLAWRAASSVEDAITVAAARRRSGASLPASAARSQRAQPPRRIAPSDRTKRIELLPGADLLRLVIVTLLAGLALLSVVGAAVTGMLWLESRTGATLPSDRERAWDALDALRTASAGVTAGLVVAVAAWTFVTVLNVRLTSGRRRNPVLAALCWPAAAAGVWWIADRVIVDASIGRVMIGFAAQAAVLAVPFLVLERSASAIGAQRTPLRIVYALTVLMLVHVQGLGGLSRLPDSLTDTDIGRSVGILGDRRPDPVVFDAVGHRRVPRAVAGVSARGRPPQHARRPTHRVEHAPRSGGRSMTAPDGQVLLGGHSFAALRSEPPPRLFATWWLRYLLALSQLVGIAVVLLREYAEPGAMDVLFVVVPHVMAAIMLVGWSALAMLDAARLVPGTRYRRSSRAWVAVVLWIGAFVAPLAAVVIVDELRLRFGDDADDLVPTALGVVGMLVCFVLVWLPFRYHVRQAHRIGAPVRVVAAWFWLPLFAAVGVLTVMALGLHDLLADGGFTDAERTVQVAVLYGVPALMFAMSTWRATTVFDEVIELRWLRWRTEWEQTLLALASQPPPGPEASPVISRPT
jgi:hypothetical protein